VCVFLQVKLLQCIKPWVFVVLTKESILNFGMLHCTVIIS
jgi:hypothetical protein